MISLSHSFFPKKDRNEKYQQYIAFLRAGVNYADIKSKHQSNNKVDNQVEKIADVAYIEVMLGFLTQDVDKMNYSSSLDDIKNAMDSLQEVQGLANKFKQGPYLSICQEYNLDYDEYNNNFANSIKEINTKIKNTLIEIKNTTQHSNSL